MECPKCGRSTDPHQIACGTCEALLTPSVLRADTPGLGGPPDDFSYTGDLPRLFRFGERYQVLEKLGEGGMGRVYKALDLELDRPVALKTSRSERGVGPDVLKRFKQELVLARTITHKNVVRIHDFGEAEGMKFFTMELIEGPTLREHIDRHGPLPLARALDLFKQLLAGLGEAHRQEVVHRDLKPQNILIDADGTLRIMDFGIARSAGSSTMTDASAVQGTSDYLSPEQLKGEPADRRSDLYAAGIVLFELVNGELPFTATRRSRGCSRASESHRKLPAKSTPRSRPTSSAFSSSSWSRIGTCATRTSTRSWRTWSASAWTLRSCCGFASTCVDIDSPSPGSRSPVPQRSGSLGPRGSRRLPSSPKAR